MRNYNYSLQIFSNFFIVCLSCTESISLLILNFRISRIFDYLFVSLFSPKIFLNF